jgi:hypothetical protein
LGLGEFLEEEHDMNTQIHADEAILDQHEELILWKIYARFRFVP